MRVLEGTGLTRRFGDRSVVHAVDIAVGTGEVIGLLGANGAGKTTLLRMLLGVLAPTAGQVRLLGEPLSRASRALVGYVPQHLGLYADLSVARNRAFHDAAYGIGRRPTSDLPVDPAAPVGELSLGLQRRLAFELAMAHDPRLLVLDEPTSGVGPLGRAALWQAIADAAQAGVGVLVTTHHLAEAEQCDRLVVMAAGRVVAAGSLEQVIADAVTVAVLGTDPGPTLIALERAGMVATLAPGGVAVPGAERSAVARVVAEAGLDDGGAEVVIRRSTLEERFVELATA